jgi:hypothetical protein
MARNPKAMMMAKRGATPTRPVAAVVAPVRPVRPVVAPAFRKGGKVKKGKK